MARSGMRIKAISDVESLKPFILPMRSKVMLCIGEGGKEVVKVVDFGVARTANSLLTRMGELPGAPAYMSPEQCRGDAVDGRSDLYSLACLLFCCVCGRTPFEGREAIGVMRKQLSEPPPDARDLSPARLSDRFADLLNKALRKDPNERYRTTTEMKAALNALVPVPTRSEHRHMGSGSSDPVVQAKVLAKLAEQANSPAQAFEYARAAMKLDPKNLVARRVARNTMARLRGGSGSMPAAPKPSVPPASGKEPE